MPNVNSHFTADSYEMNIQNASRDLILYKLHFNKKSRNFSILNMSEFYIWSNYILWWTRKDEVNKDVFISKDKAEAEKFRRNKLLLG